MCAPYVRYDTTSVLLPTKLLMFKDEGYSYFSMLDILVEANQFHLKIILIRCKIF